MIETLSGLHRIWAFCRSLFPIAVETSHERAASLAQQQAEEAYWKECVRTDRRLPGDW